MRRITTERSELSEAKFCIVQSGIANSAQPSRLHIPLSLGTKGKMPVRTSVAGRYA
jgi:hypothetical protein